MNIPETFELYIENKLSREEKKSFERELLQNHELSESYAAYCKINSALENEFRSPVFNLENDPILAGLSTTQKLAIEEDFMRFNNIESDSIQEPIIDSFYNNYVEENSSLNPSLYKKLDVEHDEMIFRELVNTTGQKKPSKKRVLIELYIGIAAAVLVLFFAGKYFVSLTASESGKISPQKAYLVYYKPGTDNELKASVFSDKRLANYFIDYKRSIQNSQIITSNQLDVSDEDYELSLLFLGILNLERNNVIEARNCLERILSIKNPVKIYATWYYLSLSYLSEGNFKDAKPFLIKLADSKNPYRKNAIAILNSVKQE
jgi:hypothetical protein